LNERIIKNLKAIFTCKGNFFTLKSFLTSFQIIVGCLFKDVVKKRVVETTARNEIHKVSICENNHLNKGKSK